MTEHLIFIPQADDWLSSNHRYGHWAVRHRRAHAWRQAACWIVRAARVPTYEAIHVEARVHKKTARRYDPHNLMPTLKACIDGLVDAGVIADDDHTRLTGPDVRPGKVSPTAPGITLIITPRDTGGPESFAMA